MNILYKVVHDIGFIVWDASVTAINLVTPNKRKGHVVPEGHPGFGGEWPEYIAPKEGDSRCSCPALNALANHGDYIPSLSNSFSLIITFIQLM